MLARLHAALLEAIAVLVPVECAGCGRPDRALCDRCRAQLEPAPLPRTTPGGLRVVTALRYEGVPRRVILALKEDDRTDLAAPLARALAAGIERMPQHPLVPVPCSPAARRRRGFDPVTVLVRAAGYRGERVLRTRRGRAQQKALGAEERARNRAGSMRSIRALHGCTVLLVDDVLTTGSTLDEAARAVRAAGGEVAGGVALAFTPRYLDGLR